MSPQDYSERQAGKTDGKADKPATPAQVKAPDAQASAKKEVEQKPSPKPTEKEALPPPAPKAAEAPAPAPKPVEQAKTEPAVEKPNLCEEGAGAKACAETKGRRSETRPGTALRSKPHRIALEEGRAARPAPANIAIDDGSASLKSLFGPPDCCVEP